jgi:hypothetical protein
MRWITPQKSGPALIFTIVSISAFDAHAQKFFDANRRQDWTGMGTYHRLGLIREQDRALDNLQTEEANLGEELSPGELEVTSAGMSSRVEVAGEQTNALESEETRPAGFLASLEEYASLEARGHSMFFGSSNILNTRDDPIQAGQFAQFVGATFDLDFRGWQLGTSYDYAWFRYYDASLAEGNFNTSTLRQSLSYDLPLFGGKASYTFEPSWQYSSVVSSESGQQTFEQWMYMLGNEFTFFPFSWMLPTFSYNFFYQNANVPNAVADKFKNDFNLGITFIPFNDFGLYISPSIQYSLERNVGIVRTDNSVTPTMSVSIQPLDFLAMDFVGSYTGSHSNIDQASYTAWSGTILVRAFVRW